MKDSSFEPMTMEQITSIADSHSCTVRVAKANELMFDLDSPESYEKFQYFFAAKLETVYPESKIQKWSSKSGNTHVCVELPEDLPVSDRIALQAMGGSDIGREFAALRCHQAGSPHPVLLFVPNTKSQEAANTDFCWTRSELDQRIVNASRDTERTRA